MDFETMTLDVSGRYHARISRFEKECLAVALILLVLCLFRRFDTALRWNRCTNWLISTNPR